MGIIIKQLLKHSIRKDILKGNKKMNHKSYVRSLSFPQNMFYLMKYHKKKINILNLSGYYHKNL